jgi:membrane protein required for colicin V production
MNWTDYLIIALLVFSCVAGLMRGVLREMISLLTWILAITLAWRCAGLLEPHLGGALAGAAVRPWAARTLIFLSVMLIGTAVGAVVTHYVRLSIFSGMDRLLGVLFGLGRGAVALGLLTILCHAVRIDDERWYRESILVPYAENAAKVIRAFAGADSSLIVSTYPASLAAEI